MGESSPEARERHLSTSYGEPSVERLAVFRYSVWTFWRAKFYDWLNAWAARMRGKTEELSIKQLTTDLESTQPCDAQNNVEEVVDQKQTDSVCDAYQLPKDFVPGSVVMIHWSQQMITDAALLKTTTSILDADNRPAIKVQNMSFPRRLRISIEHHILSPSRLLKEVAHFDSNPSFKVLDSLDPTANTNEHHVILVRMRSASAAHQLTAFVNQQLSEGHLNHNLVSTKLLLDAEERVCCQAIFESKIGASERRRRIQAKRRQRTKERVKQQDTALNPVNDGPRRRGDITDLPNSAKKSKHIFIEEDA